jgi:hypothetical protein
LGNWWKYEIQLEKLKQWLDHKQLLYLQVVKVQLYLMMLQKNIMVLLGHLLQQYGTARYGVAGAGIQTAAIILVDMHGSFTGATEE